MLNRISAACLMCAAIAAPVFAQIALPPVYSRTAESPPVTFVPPPAGVSPITYTPPPAEVTPMPGWLAADALIAFFNSASAPPLVTTGQPGPLAGVVSVPGTTILYGARGVNEDARLGGRVQGGFLLLPETGLMAEAGVMLIESQARIFSAASDGSAVLARPFTSTATGAGTSILVASPGISSGGVNVRQSSGNLYEAHLGVSKEWCGGAWWRFGSLLGYRFYKYDEGLVMTQDVSPLGAAFVPGTRISTSDSFLTSNEFHGFNIGARAAFGNDTFSVGLTAQVAAGNLHREVKIRGAQTVSVPGAAPVTGGAGLYALSSNSGLFKSNDAAVFPELGITAAWQATPNLKLRVGYTGFVLGQVATAGQQVDTVINPALLPPSTQAPAANDRPRFGLSKYDVWAHALQLGAEVNW